MTALCFYPLFTGAQSIGLFPDLRTTLPHHLRIQNKQQKEILRFSNGIANTGAGDLRLRPQFPANPNDQQGAIQEILDANGNIVSESLVSQFEFHPEHNHWHIANVARYELRTGSPAGAVYGSNSFKTTFCLIDWYQLNNNSPTKERTYFECNSNYQGISPGWVDQYHQSIPGQEVDITGAPAGTYCLMSTANPDASFIETDYSNNSAWVCFILRRNSNGNASIQITSKSPCADIPALCDEKVPNR